MLKYHVLTEENKQNTSKSYFLEQTLLASFTLLEIEHRISHNGGRVRYLLQQYHLTALAQGDERFRIWVLEYSIP